MRKLLSLNKIIPIILFFSTILFYGQTDQEKTIITSRYNLEKLNDLKNQFESNEITQKQSALQIAQLRGLQTKLTLPDGGFAELQRIDSDGSLIYYRTWNVNAARSTRTNHLNIGGSLGLNLDGQNMIAYVWDGGHARVSHQEYDGPGGNDRVTLHDTSTEGGTQLNYHAAHVTGTITASGLVANSKGMAPQSRVRGYMWNNDLSEATTAASNGMLLSNHSYGYRSDLVPNYYFGAYITDSRDWDALQYNAPYYLMVVAAGNDGTTNYNGAPLNPSFPQYDKLTGHSTSKNTLVVANAQDANVDSNGNLISVTINSSSSQGPTDDYRIKPDITGNGTSVYSTYENGNSSYGSLTGTSMASPNVTGTLLLLQQYANQENGAYMRAATLKGLALHTADDAGMTGPDAIYGWGLLNAKRAAETITQNAQESIISELTLFPGQSFTIDVQSDGINDLLASISWTDPAGIATTATNNTTARLVNDLDIRVTKDGTTYYPWRLTGVNTNGKGDNIKDPFERVDIENASGTYTITVTNKGALSGGSQNFTLIITGLSVSPVSCTATVPSGLTPSGVGSNSAILSWNTVDGATYDLRYRVVGTSPWTTVAVSGTSTTLSSLTPSTNYEAQVRSKCPDNTTSAYSSSTNFTTQDVQLQYCTSKGNNVNDEYIGRVQLNTIDNTSGSGNGYSDFTNISTNLSKTGSYTITVTPVWTGTVYAEGYAVWIDYNHDGDFTDSGEQVWTRTATTNSPVSGTFTVPSSALDGPTRMRVSMKYNGIPSSCETFTYGEVEDYTINILGGGDTQPPTAPTNLAASNITQTTLSLTWNASTDNVGVVGYDVYMGGGLLGTVTTTSANVTGLTANTAYSFYVVAKDAADNMSPPSNTVNVSTLPVAVNYCHSQGNNTNDEYINRVQLGNINNLSGNNGGYADFTNLSTNLAKGSSNTIIITPAWTGIVYMEAYRVWIDYNQDGDFSDSGELVYNRTRTTASPITGNFVVPASALSGATRMRVSMKYNASPNPCETFTYGEVEDYTVVITNSVQNYHTATVDSNALQIYPNPVENVLNINLSGYQADEIRIYNVTGQLVSKAFFEPTLNVSSLRSGVYFLEIAVGEEVLIKRFVKK